MHTITIKTMKHVGTLFLTVTMLLVTPLDANPDTTSEDTLTARIQSVSFESAILDTKKTFCAVLPDGYDKAAHPWPVLFLFHGRGRTERSLIDDPGARATLLPAPFVTILPDGDDGWYINSPAIPEDRYQDYMDEVVALAAAKYNLSTDPKHRGLSGWSMGGFGSTRYAITHHDKFAALAPIIGLLDFPRTGLPAGQSYAVPMDRFGDDETLWTTLNPINHADNLRDMALCIITGSTAFDRTMNENFSARLTELGIEHDWHTLPGGHSFDVVRESLPIVVKFMTKHLTPMP